MLKGSTLLVALLISLVISIIIISIISFSYFSKLEFQSYIKIDKLNLNTTSGINILLANSDTKNPFIEKQKLDLYSNKTDSVELQLKPWGIYDIAVSTAFTNGETISKIALAGYQQDFSNPVALYLTDQNQALGLCGHTIINGICYLPKEGVKKLKIENLTFKGDTLINGTINTSERETPELDEDLVNKIKNITSIGEKSSNYIQFESLKSDSIIRGFDTIPTILFSQKIIQLDKGTFKGNIIIYSKAGIKVSGTARIEDAILVAPFITFSGKFIGNCQAFSADSIIIHKDCKLNYPSVICLYHNISSCKFPFIKLDSSSYLCGSIISYSVLSNPNKSVINIYKGATLQGEVYTNENMDLSGIVDGKMVCSHLTLSTSHSVYENALLDATIDRSKLNKDFIGINATIENNKKGIMKWLF